MPRHLICDAHERSNEVLTVPTYNQAKSQPRERSWKAKRGKKTLFSLTLVWNVVGWFEWCSNKWEYLRVHQWKTTTFDVDVLTWGKNQNLKSKLDVIPGHFQVGSLAGAAHLLNNNTDASNRTHFEWKSNVECKGKSFVDLDSVRARV